MDPSISGPKSAIERHHLFPRAYLREQGITESRQVNQIANFAQVEWPENLSIGAKAPADYVPPLDAGLSAAERERQYFWHALPSRWWEMSYDDFLTERRGRIARVIRRAWEQLTHGHANEQVRAPTVAELIAAGESGGVEYKATLRTNLHTRQPDEKMHLAALKSIAGS